jgi:hypothetical protein
MIAKCIITCMTKEGGGKNKSAHCVIIMFMKYRRGGITRWMMMMMKARERGKARGQR